MFESFWKGLRGVCVLLAGAALGCLTASAQKPPEPIRLAVDASHAPQKILHAHMQIPVHAGPMTLYYPEWIPGEHMPDGPIIDVAGLIITGNGKRIPWRRDLVEMFSIHLDVPKDVKQLDVDLDFLLAAASVGFSAGSSATASLDLLSWNQVLLYPSGYNARDIIFIPSLRLPAGWKYGTALPGAKTNGDAIEFDPVPLTTLVDSPVISGKYFRVIQLTPGQNPSHEIDIAADSAAALAMPPELELHFRQLVAETGALFGARHYRDYHFLLTLSDDVAHFGLEHHESSDDRTSERSLIDESERLNFVTLFPHEFTHSWNGKYRRPAGLATPDYQQPMKDDLLWVYEGMTQYWGDLVLPARSGLWTAEQTREALALTAATYAQRPGRDWRPLQDTADAAPFLYNAGAEWSNWRRGTDFYDEGMLLWLDVDSTLRSLSGDKKSMNDFCPAFYGGPGGEPALKTYTFEDVVAALNSLAPYDWAGFLRKHLDATPAPTPIEAVENSGWKLVYNEEPNDIEVNAEDVEGGLDLAFSIGLMVDSGGVVRDVIHGGPAYAAGIGPGMKIVAVNSLQFSGEGLRGAIDAAKNAPGPIHLLVSNGAQFQDFSVDYHGGLKYPHIERNADRPDYLSEILRPLAK
ncbi:MAG TPA: PDZ domain-containing protein [Candidatus Limnocylindrales bacterium]|nr:PDZ domain-containing protein [Candidatus Limnocylindrales bacterium]